MVNLTNTFYFLPIYSIYFYCFSFSLFFGFAKQKKGISEDHHPNEFGCQCSQTHYFRQNMEHQRS